MNVHSEFRRARRIAAMEISEIVQLSERAAALRAAGKDVVALSTGEPDFPTPAHVVDAANAAALAGKTRYPATLGTPELRDAIARENGVHRAEVIVSTGAKQVLANAMLATLDAGDEVIMPAPYWTSYSDIVAMAGGSPVVLPCGMEQGFKLLPEQLEAAITPKTRWLMLNSPSNPSGAIYSTDEQRALADVLGRHPHVMILVDEIYAHLSFEPFTSFKEIAPELAERMLVVNGVSKAYSMTGGRIGWGIGPAEMIRAMGAVQGQVTSGASSISQAAALAALNAIPGVHCPTPDGAFYVFPNMTEAMEMGGYASDADLCSALLDEAGVAIVPGRAFGLPGHARLSFAYSDAELDAGLERMSAHLKGK
ncbi:MAG: pyridoxal phosphate-dependent aminotransferase [Maritimibacter sp.]